MKKNTCIIAMMALALLTAENSVMALTTIGDRSCGQWVGRTKSPLDRIGAENWLMGFMTGLAVDSQKDVLAEPDGDSLILWMDNYCKSHPLDTVGAGATVLYRELLSRKR
jgi:hypothetical protein